MKLRTYLRILALLGVTVMTWAAAPPPARAVAGKLLPLCNCNDDFDCPSMVCGFRNCSSNGDKFLVCD
jgi:hypothetical protein